MSCQEARPLWGKDGAVARCAQQKIPNGGRWRITEAELVQELKPEKPRAVGSASAPLGYAIIDDLVPRGPEILMGRILEVAGYLDNPYTADPSDRYNPIMITMEEVLHLKPGQAPAAEDILERERIKHTIQVPSPPGEIIRSVNYLWKSWRPSGFFPWSVVVAPPLERYPRGLADQHLSRGKP